MSTSVTLASALAVATKTVGELEKDQRGQEKEPVTLQVVYEKEERNSPPESEPEAGAVPSPNKSPKKYL